jgi:hypothetical protein
LALLKRLGLALIAPAPKKIQVQVEELFLSKNKNTAGGRGSMYKVSQYYTRELISGHRASAV